MNTEVIRKDSIEELIGHRNYALDLAKRGAELIMEAQRAASKAAPSEICKGSLTRETLGDLSGSYAKPERFIENARKEWDREIWRHLLHYTGIASLMDREAREKFMAQMDWDVPEATVENILATFEQLRDDAQTIFERGIVNAFAGLSYNFKTNEPFRLTDKIIIEYAFADIGGNSFITQHWNFRQQETIRDVERVFRILDGREPLPGYGGICGAIDEVRKQHGPWPREAENEYFRAKWYKKGTLHLTFKRPDLVRKANEMIARHFGEVLADAS